MTMHGQKEFIAFLRQLETFPLYKERHKAAIKRVAEEVEGRGYLSRTSGVILSDLLALYIKQLKAQAFAAKAI